MFASWNMYHKYIPQYWNPYSIAFWNIPWKIPYHLVLACQQNSCHSIPIQVQNGQHKILSLNNGEMLGRSFGFKIRLAAKSIDNELSAPNDGSKIFSMPTKFINRIFHLFPSLFVHAGMSFVLTTKRQRWKQQKLLVPIVFHFLIFFPPPFSIVGQEQSPFSLSLPLASLPFTVSITKLSTNH